MENMDKRARRLRVGEWVEVRSKEEILKTLDGRARLDGMPFMPEMFAFCGKKFQVFKKKNLILLSKKWVEKWSTKMGPICIIN